MLVAFDGLTILDIYGVERLPLAGELDAEALADRLVAEWIPYFECHKCGRFDYCKFVQRRTGNKDLAKDIQCGVVEAALRLFIEHTYRLLERLRADQRQDYLDAAFHFCQFVLDAEIDIGRYMNRAFVEHWMHMGPSFFGAMVRLPEHLDRIAEKMKSIPAFKSERPVLFVEGHSEHAFLAKLRESHSSWFLDLIVEVYGGRGNRRLKRIEMLLERYQRQGYKIFIQGDADGGSRDCFRSAVAKGLVTHERTFLFSHDFESSIPPGLLLFALQQLGELEGLEPAAFRNALGRHKGAIQPVLLAEYGLDLEPLKLELASEVADALNHPNLTWWRDERFLETELGRFLRFIQHLF